MTAALEGRQGTVASPVFFEGRGLHTGRHCFVTVHPAGENHGLVFETVAKGRRATIPASWEHVRELPLCTCLADGRGSQVRTVEHLLAACYAAGVDNALIEVRGAEIPLLDGSAKPFVDAFSCAGVMAQTKPRRILRVTKTITVTDGPRWIKIEPWEGFHVAVQTYVKPFGRLPWWSSDIDRGYFAREVAPARTFGSLAAGLLTKCFTWFLPDPLCLGANRENAVVIFQGRILTPGGLRYADEFSRHRALDLIGDLMLAGTDFQAKFTCFSPVHRLSRKALEAVMKETSNHPVPGRKQHPR